MLIIAKNEHDIQSNTMAYTRYSKAFFNSYFAPIKTSKTRKYKIISFDTETYGRQNKFYMGSVLDDNGIHSFIDKKDMLSYMISPDRKGWNQSIIFATNLEFDFNAIADRKTRTKFKPIYSNSKLLGLTYKNGNVKRRFWDTTNYAFASVEKMGELLKLPKIKHPKNFIKIVDRFGIESYKVRKPRNKKEHDELIRYNIRDCEVTKGFAEYIQDNMIRMGGKLRMTIASCAKDLFQRRYLKMNLLAERHALNDLKINNTLFKAYYGGRTEVFKRGWIRNVNYYDVNSLYPSMMLKPFPLPNSIRRVYTPDKNILRYEGISKVNLYCPEDIFPLLPYRKDGKLIFPTGYIKNRWYTNYEIRKAISIGYRLDKLHETIYFRRTFYPFKDYVIDMYDNRMNAKANDNPDEYFFKIMMNSLYGKFGERSNTETEYISLDEQEGCSDKYDNLVVDDDGYGYGLLKKECKKNHVMPILPIYVTAYARCHLYDLIKDADPYYVDTDSVITKKKLPESMKLGELKLEKRIKNGIIIRPKLYILDYKPKAKGIKGINDRMFMNMIKTKKASFNKFTHYKESVRQGIKPNEIVDTTKYLSLEDSKRIWKGRFDPFILDESSKAIHLNNT